MLKITSPQLPQSLKEKDNLSELLANKNKDIFEMFFQNQFVEDISQPKLYVGSSQFINCVFSSCSFSMAQLSDVVFKNCDLSNINFTGSNLSRVAFDGCKLTGTNFSEALLYHVSFRECRGDYSIFTASKQRDVLFLRSSLQGAAFDNCRFNPVSFDSCNLTESEFYQTPLKSINFCNSEITGIRVQPFTNSELRGATITSLQALELTRLLGIKIQD